MMSAAMPTRYRSRKEEERSRASEDRYTWISRREINFKIGNHFFRRGEKFSHPLIATLKKYLRICVMLNLCLNDFHIHASEYYDRMILFWTALFLPYNKLLSLSRNHSICDITSKLRVKNASRIPAHVKVEVINDLRINPIEIFQAFELKYWKSEKSRELTNCVTISRW